MTKFRTLILIFVVSLASGLIIALITASKPVSQDSPIPIEPSTKAVLTKDPDANTYTLKLLGDSSDLTVIDLQFTFNPQAISITHINPLLWSQANILDLSIDNSQGSVSYAAGIGFTADTLHTKDLLSITYQVLDHEELPQLKFAPASNITKQDDDFLTYLQVSNQTN